MNDNWINGDGADWSEVEDDGKRIIFNHGSVAIKHDERYIVLDFRESPQSGRYIEVVLRCNRNDARLKAFISLLDNNYTITGHWTDITNEVDENGLRWFTLQYKDQNPTFNKSLSFLLTPDQVGNLKSEIENALNAYH